MTIRHSLTLYDSTCLCWKFISRCTLISPRIPPCWADWRRSQWCPSTKEGWDWHCDGFWHRCGQICLRNGSCWRQLLHDSCCCGGGPCHLQQHETVHSLPHFLQRWRGCLVRLTREVVGARSEVPSPCLLLLYLIWWLGGDCIILHLLFKFAFLFHYHPFFDRLSQGFFCLDSVTHCPLEITCMVSCQRLSNIDWNQ